MSHAKLLIGLVLLITRHRPRASRLEAYDACPAVQLKQRSSGHVLNIFHWKKTQQIVRITLNIPFLMLLWFLFCLARADPISVKVPTSATLDVRLHRTKLLFCLKNSCFGSNFSWNCEGHKTNRFDFFLFSEFFRQKKYRALKKTCSWASHKFFRVAWSRVSQSRESHVRGKIYSSSSFVIHSLPVEWTNFWMSVRLSWSSHRLAKALTFLKKVR